VSLSPGEPEVTNSALKHVLEKSEILHAYRNPIEIFDFDDGFVMVIGAYSAGNLLEVDLVIESSEIRIVHAMNAREKFLKGQGA
jgi:hypothetical protein